MISGWFRWKRQLWRLQRAERQAYRAWYRRRLALAKAAYATGAPASGRESDDVERLYELFRAAHSARMAHEGWNV